MIDVDARQELIDAMVLAIPGSAASVAYMNDAEYHALIHTLADLWITLAPTLVEQSIKRQAEIRRQIDIISGRTTTL